MKYSAMHIARLAQHTASFIGVIGCALLLQQAFVAPLVPRFITALACFGGLLGFFIAIYWQARLEVKGSHAEPDQP